MSVMVFQIIVFFFTDIFLPKTFISGHAVNIGFDILVRVSFFENLARNKMISINCI